MEKELNKITISIGQSVYERLVFLKQENDTFSDVIERLLDGGITRS